MKQRAAALAAILLAALLLSACGASGSAGGPPPDLTGRWTQVNPADNFYQVATISGDEIEVYWHLVDDDSEYLYWAGSYVPPQDGREPYSWVSENDLEKARTSSRARREDTLTFTYKDGKLHFIQIQGRIHLTVALEKAE